MISLLCLSMIFFEWPSQALPGEYNKVLLILKAEEALTARLRRGIRKKWLPLEEQLSSVGMFRIRHRFQHSQGFKFSMPHTGGQDHSSQRRLDVRLDNLTQSPFFHIAHRLTQKCHTSPSWALAFI